MKFTKIVLVFVFLPLFACNDDSEQFLSCTSDYRYGLGVEVKDEAGNPVSEVDIVVRDLNSDYEETLQDGFNDGSYFGLGERGGSYEMTVSKDGFQSAVQEISIQSDECHVIPESLTITLIEN